MGDAISFPRLSVTSQGIGWPRNAVLLAIALCQLIFTITLCVIFELPLALRTAASLMMLGTTLVPLFMLVLMVLHFLRLAIFDRPVRPLHRYLNDVRVVVLDPQRILTGLTALVMISLFTSSFSLIKAHITVIQPFVWDPYFAWLDRTIHFGHDPWVLLQPLFGTPLATTILNANYHFWLFLMYFMLFLAAFDRHETARSATFIFALLLSFSLGGNVLAILFASSGPVYYQEFGFGTDFTPLVQQLHDFNEISPVWALNVQQMLLDGFNGKGTIRGISAMPSMHVASSVVMTLYAFSWRRWAGWIMTGFSALIILGSVHLAWHYAVDGYLGIGVAFASWWLAGQLNRLVANKTT